MTEIPQPERLDVLAALIEGSDDDAMMASATTGELDLADAVRGPSVSDADAAAIAALLRLADVSPLAGALRIKLREAFLDGDPPDHAAAFAEAYERLAVPGLAGDTVAVAVGFLATLGGQTGHGG